MKTYVACLVIALGVLHYTTADYQTYSYDTSAGIDGALSVVGSLCGGVIAKLGINGCRGLLQG